MQSTIKSVVVQKNNLCLPFSLTSQPFFHISVLFCIKMINIKLVKKGIQFKFYIFRKLNHCRYIFILTILQNIYIHNYLIQYTEQ